MRLAAVVATVTGLVVLFVGMADAVPLVFFGTPEERESLEQGRRIMWAGAILLALAAALLAARGHPGRSLLVASPGAAALALVYAYPDGSYAWLAFLPLGALALIAALTSARIEP